MTTFAVVGHDEAETVSLAAAQVLAACRPDDLAVFVDSASTDGSAEVAREHGLEVWPAPLGKGAAVREALRRQRHEWLVLLDADIHDSERNLAVELARGVEHAGAEVGMVLGDFDDRPAGGVLSNTWAVYEPLAAALFPEIAGRCGTHPLTGFRALRAAALPRPELVPDDFGLEAWFNASVAAGGWATQVVHLGWYTGRFRYKPTMGREIAAGLLAAAVDDGRLDPSVRPAWEAWVEQVVDVVRGYRGEEAGREDFLAALAAVRRRPLPPTRQDGAP